MKYIFGFMALLVSMPSFSASSFIEDITEIQVLEDRVRLKVGVTYGTCGEKEGWWGWSTTHDRHKDWLAIAMTAYAQNSKIVVYDAQSSCSGLSDAIQLEGLYLKK